MHTTITNKLHTIAKIGSLMVSFIGGNIVGKNQENKTIASELSKLDQNYLEIDGKRIKLTSSIEFMSYNRQFIIENGHVNFVYRYNGFGTDKHLKRGIDYENED